MNRGKLIGWWTLGVFCGSVILFFAWFAVLNMRGETIALVKEIFGYKLSFVIPRWIDIFIIPAWPAVLVSLFTWKRIKELDILDFRRNQGMRSGLVAIISGLAIIFGISTLILYPVPLWSAITATIVLIAITLVLTEVYYFSIAQNEKSKLKGFLGTFSLNIISGFSFGIWAIFSYGAIIALLLSLVITIVLIILQIILMKGFSFLTLLFREIAEERKKAKAK